jgi:RNA polymerase sigma-70 factor (ECF subfamily)
MVRNVHEAEDIVQEALLRVLRLARNGRLRCDPAQARSLAFGIAHNLAMDARRRSRPEPTPNRPDSPPAFRMTEEGLVQAEIERALVDLPSKQRSAWLLRVHGELSYAEVASALGASLDEVKVWIHRARKRLAQLVDRDGQYVGDRRDGM